jgi:signal transduction histidine kinase/ActR/RegA family two-component response regulator
LRRAAAWLVFFVAYLGAAIVGSADYAVVQSIAWLATGVGIAGVWLLGLRSTSVVVLAATVHRYLHDYPPLFWFESVGSGLEAAVGAMVMWRMGLQPDLARLRDVAVLFVVAAVTPFVSMLIAWLPRIPTSGDDLFGFLGAWEVWWRMNALGALTIVPIVLTWHARLQTRLNWRSLLEGALLGGLAIAVLWVVVFVLRPSVAGLTAANSVLGVALLAAVRQGPIGAVSIGSVSWLFLAFATTHGHGPLQSVPLEERHAVAQVILLTLVGVPLVFGALIAERAAHARQRMRSEEARLAVQAMLPDATLRLQADGRISDVYLPPGQELLLPRTPVVGEALAELFDDKVRPRFVAALARALVSERTAPVDFQLQMGAGTRACEACLVPASDGDVFVVVRDVTERRDLAARLHQAQKLEAVGLLASGVAHDFNNLLTVVLGSADVLRQSELASGDVHALAGDIADAAQRGAMLTQQLLAFSRQQVRKPEILDSGVVVGQTVGLLRRLLGSAIEVVVEAAPQMWVRADRCQLEQIVMNLAVNGRDAMPDGGTLTIATRAVDVTGDASGRLQDGRYVQIEVRDTGVGMSPEVCARVFEPFFTTKELGHGTGLGLATVYGIVAQSGGAIAVDSALGAGTAVQVWLPRVADPGIQAVESVPAAVVAGATGRLLVVEDEDAVRELFCRALVQAGHQVASAACAEAALQLVATEPPFDLLVTDLVMPRVGGAELARRLRAQMPRLPVLFVSAHPRDKAMSEVPTEAGFGYLAKPVDLTEMVAKIASMLAERQ